MTASTSLVRDGVAPAEVSPADLDLLRRAIAVAAEARASGAHPFGSLVATVDGRVVIEAGNNSRPPEGDPTQHAEVRALAGAWRLIGPDAMRTATLFTSAEPCAMCTGAAYWTGIGRIVYALSEAELLTLTGADAENPTMALPCREVVKHGQRPIEVVGPLLTEEATVVHDGFWTG